MHTILMNTESISSGGSSYTEKEHLFDNRQFHGLEYEITGSGSVTITAYTTISGKNWIKDIIVAKSLVATSGPGGDGKGLVDLFIHPAEFVKFLVEVASATAVVTIWLVQK